MQQGHIRQRGKRWCIVVELERDPSSGKRRQKWMSFESRDAARRELHARLLKLDNGENPFPSEVSVADWIGRWLDFLRTNGNLRPHTIRSYEGLTRHHVIPRIGAMSMRKVKPAHVQSVLDAVSTAGRSPQTVERVRAAMGACWQHALRMEVVDTNPVRATRGPRKVAPTLRTPTAADLNAIRDAAKGTPWEIPIMLSTTTGARRGGVLGLRWGNVDLERGRARIVEAVQRVEGRIVWVLPKTARGVRVVPLLPDVVERLRQHRRAQAERLLALGQRLDDSFPICDRGDGLPLDPDAYGHGAKRIAAAAGVDGVRLHDFRHGVATLLAAQHNPPELTSQMLGHATVGFTLTSYTHPRDDAMDEVGARLGRALSG